MVIAAGFYCVTFSCGRLGAFYGLIGSLLSVLSFLLSQVLQGVVMFLGQGLRGCMVDYLQQLKLTYGV
jgi:hypothetical protein